MTNTKKSNSRDRKEYLKSYRKKNAEKIKLYTKKHYIKHREAKKAKSNEYSKKFRSDPIAYQNYLLKNREREKNKKLQKKQSIISTNTPNANNIGYEIYDNPVENYDNPVFEEAFDQTLNEFIENYESDKEPELDDALNEFIENYESDNSIHYSLGGTKKNKKI